MVAIGRIFQGAGRLLFDPKFTDVAARELTASKKVLGWKNIHKQIGDSFVKAEQESIKENPSLWKGMKKSFTTMPSDMQSAWKGATGAWGKTKAIGKTIWGRMPLIGGALMLGFELPNIISAFQDKGLVGGIIETAKSGTRLLGSMAGFAIGQALIPIPVLGGLIGSFACDWLISKVVGKSHSEQKAEAEEKQQAMLQQQMPQGMEYPQQNTTTNSTYSPISMPQMTLTPQQLMAMQQQLYGGGLTSPMDQDFMAMTSGINKLNYLG